MPRSGTSSIRTIASQPEKQCLIKNRDFVCREIVNSNWIDKMCTIRRQAYCRWWGGVTHYREVHILEWLSMFDLNRVGKSCIIQIKTSFCGTLVNNWIGYNSNHIVAAFAQSSQSSIQIASISRRLKQVLEFYLFTPTARTERLQVWLGTTLWSTTTPLIWLFK